MILRNKGTIILELHLNLAKVLLNDDLDSLRVAQVTKNTEVGQGLKFLPRELNDLVKSLQVLLDELAETGKIEVHYKVAAVLEELLRRNGISGVMEYLLLDKREQ